MNYSAMDIAIWFLAKNRRKDREDDGEKDGLTNLKLQKLLYYAQGAYMHCNNGEPLFSEEIEAWQHGPVVPEVYQAFKQYGSNDIYFEEDYDFSSIDEKTTKVLDFVYDNMAIYSAWYLRNLTHEERPWLETPRGRRISKGLINSFFHDNFKDIFGIYSESNGKD